MLEYGDEILARKILNEEKAKLQHASINCESSKEDEAMAQQILDMEEEFDRVTRQHADQDEKSRALAEQLQQQEEKMGKSPTRGQQKSQMSLFNKLFSRIKAKNKK